MENNNNVVTKSELKNFQLISKMEDTIQALTDAKKETDEENEELILQNDIIKKENARLSETNNAVTLELSDLKRKCEVIKVESEKCLSSKEAELKSANEKISAQDELLLQKQNVEAELKAANERILGQGELLLRKQNIEVELKAANERISEQNECILKNQRENNFLKFLTKPIITDEDLIEAGAVVDKWNGTAILNAVNLKRQYMKNAWSIAP